MLRPRFVTYLALTVCCAAPTIAQHRVCLQGDERLVILAADGEIEWEMPWGEIHDLHVLPNGNIMVQRGTSEVVEIERTTRAVVWSYDAATSNGNAGKPVEVHSFEPLTNGNVRIAESGPARIIEIDRLGKLISEFPLTVQRPVVQPGTRVSRPHPNRDSRLMRSTPMRLDNGNTLITTGNGHSALEVTPKMEVTWFLTRNELDGIQLASVTTLQVLTNGNYVIGNCHAGPDQPLLIEVDPKTKAVVWQLDRHADFGNEPGRLPEDARGRPRRRLLHRLRRPGPTGRRGFRARA